MNKCNVSVAGVANMNMGLLIADVISKLHSWIDSQKT